jgi:hypothetical protein
VINSQLSAFIKIKKILNSTDKTGILKESLLTKIKLKEKKLQRIGKINKCKIIKKD